MFPLFREFEPHMRAAMQLALEHWALERAGQLDEEPFRRGHRTAILARAAEPLRDTLGEAGFDRLIKALSVLFGIEPYIVLKDMWAATNREVDEITRWMAQAIVDAALRDAAVHRGKGAAPAGGRADTAARRPAHTRRGLRIAAAAALRFLHRPRTTPHGRRQPARPARRHRHGPRRRRR